MQKKIIWIALLMLFAVNCFGCSSSKRVITNDMAYSTNLDENTDRTNENDPSDNTGMESDHMVENADVDGGMDAALYDNREGVTLQIPVHVCGAVNNPGVYYFNEGDLVTDALSAAGGYAVDAARDYVNLAATLCSGERLYFPYENEVSDMNLNPEDTMQMQQEEQVPGNAKVNINLATKDELMTLPGIGETRALAIIQYREQQGPFDSIADICLVSGIKEATFEKIKEKITVN